MFLDLELLDDFKLEVELFPAHDRREIELPKLSRKPKCWPALIQIHDKLHAQRAPKIRQADACFERPELGRGVERKWGFRRHEASEGVAVEMIAVRRIGGPIGVRVVRRENLESAAGLGNPMQLRDEPDYIRHVLDHMTANDLFKLVVTEWIRKNTEVMNDVGMTSRVRVDADRAGELVLAAAYVQNAFAGFGHALSFSAAANQRTV